MAQRYIKIALALTVGLLAGLWAVNNLLNWEIAHGAMAYALSQENQSGYQVHLIPPIRSAAAATAGLALIVLTEATAGVLSLIGAFRMWSQRNADAAAFARAKETAILGAGVAILNWFFGFLIVGGTIIMMGQAEGMESAMRGAVNMTLLCFLTLIYLSMTETGRDA